MADTRSVAARHRLALALIPADILKSVPADELADRIVHAEDLSRRAADPSVPADLRRAYKLRAQAVLRAQPRAVTERQHAELIAKAAAAPGRFQEEAIRRQARELIEEKHPVAPRRAAAVRKAKAEEAEPVPVFDADGNLIGICDADDITPVAGAGSKRADSADGSGQPQPGQAAAAQVVKAAGQVVIYDQWRRPHLTDGRCIRRTAWPQVAKAAAVKGLVQVFDEDGRSYWARPEDLRGPGSPEAQARDTGPATAGRTTGLGQPRQAGPAAALPADGPQRARPGDVPGRQVIKAAPAPARPFKTVGEAARERRLAAQQRR